jgi:hypothetical protein
MSFFARNIQDAKLQTSKVLPAANANNDTSSIDLGAGGVFQPESVEVLVSVPALPALVEAKKVTIKLQDSANNSSFADVDPLIQTVVTGGVGGGAAAKAVRFKLPAPVRRYIRWNQAVENAGGDNTGVSVSYKLLF